jgi:hypothetical protein
MRWQMLARGLQAGRRPRVSHGSKPALSTLTDGDTATVQTPRRKLQAPSVSLDDQNRAAELKVGADKAPEALS